MLKTDILHIKAFISYLFQNCGIAGKRTYLFMRLYETNKKYREKLNRDVANIPGLINLWKCFINDVVVDRISKYDVAINLINARSLIDLDDNDNLWLTGFIGNDGKYCEWEVMAATNLDSPVRIGCCHRGMNVGKFIPSYIDGIEESKTKVTYLFPNGLVVNGNIVSITNNGFDNLIFGFLTHQLRFKDYKFLNSKKDKYNGCKDSGVPLLECPGQFIQELKEIYDENTTCCIVYENEMYGLSDRFSEKVNFKRAIDYAVRNSFSCIHLNEDNIGNIMNSIYDIFNI